MTRTLTLIILLLSVCSHGRAEVTLDYCLKRAEENYPVIKKYGILENSTELNLSEINRGWLPNIGIYAQGNVQNVVPAFPSVLRNMLAQNGFELKGMSKLQYKLAAELNQTIWDGGASKASREIERAALDESRAALDVELYGVRSQVESLFFGILLIQEQMKQTQSTIDLLTANLQRLQSMIKNGTAMQSDADMVEAQCLTLKQNLSTAQSSMEGYRSVLSIYMGEDIGATQLRCPEAIAPQSTNSNRPELTLFDKQIAQNVARERGIDAAVMPRVGFFTQAYYGYPGYNYFESMTNRNLSFNIMAGVKVSWNVDGLYTKSLKRKKLALNTEIINVDRENFLFNSRLKSTQEEAEIKAMHEVMKEDSRIVELRGNVRRSAESQLRNGVIDVTALLTKINDENQAKLNSAYHKIQLVQNIYKLKNTLNQ
ncbi:MAG: TolC family protein [Muribaculaceae bacterium]|nr:TolC family protein [Muribaculaceae bacterium]